MGIQTKAFHIISLLILPILVIQTGLVFYGYCSAAEVETRIQGINRDASAVREQMPESKFVLVPIPVSNPTVGVGLTLAGIYLHGREQAEKDGPTTTTGLGVMYTSNESWLVGAFHDGYYFNDFMRLNLAAGYGELHLKYYGTGNDSIFCLFKETWSGGQSEPYSLSYRSGHVFASDSFRLVGAICSFYNTRI